MVTRKSQDPGQSHLNPRRDLVAPAKAGAPAPLMHSGDAFWRWIPAFAGKTSWTAWPNEAAIGLELSSNTSPQPRRSQQKQPVKPQIDAIGSD